MPKRTSGAIHLIPLIFLVVLGIAAIVGAGYLTRRTSFKQKASCPNETRIIIYESSAVAPPNCQEASVAWASRNVKLRLIYVPQGSAISAPVGTCAAGTFWNGQQCQTSGYTPPQPITPPPVITPPSYTTTPTASPGGFTTPPPPATYTNPPPPLPPQPVVQSAVAQAGSVTIAPPAGNQTASPYPTHFRVSNENDTSTMPSASPRPYTITGTTIDWQLSPGNGKKTVYADFWVNGGWISLVSASVTLNEPGAATPTPSPITFPTQTVTYNLYPGDNFIGMPFGKSFTGYAGYTPARLLADTGGKCDAIWTVDPFENRMLVWPTGARVTNFLTNAPVPDSQKFGLGGLADREGYFVRCSSPITISITAEPMTSIDTTWKGKPKDQNYPLYVAVPYNNQNADAQSLKALDLLNALSTPAVTCTEVLTPRVICPTDGSNRCSISGITVYKKGFSDSSDNFTLVDTTGYAVRCQATAPSLLPTPVATPLPSPSPSPAPPTGLITKNITIKFKLAGRNEAVGRGFAEGFELLMDRATNNFTNPEVRLTGAVDKTGTYVGLLSVTPNSVYKARLRARHSVPIETTLQFDTIQTAAIDFKKIPNGNANGDTVINIMDFSRLASSFNSRKGEARYNPDADFNTDGRITILDFSILAGNFGKGPITISPPSGSPTPRPVSAPVR